MGISLEGAKVLVIGGAGFIGSYLVEQLTGQGVAEVLVYDNFCRGTRTNLVESMKDKRVKVFELGGDITQPDILGMAMKGVDYVFHLAALWLLHCHEYPKSAFEVNIKGTFNVLDTCVANKVKKLIYSSSASVYGDAVEIPMTENHPYNNKTFYGATKIAGEAMCEAYHARYGLNYVGLRYGNVYGPRQDDKGVYTSVIVKAIASIEQGISPTIYGDGSQSYDFVYVGDVARANICAMESNIASGFYNVGTGKGTSINELVTLLLDIMDSKLQPRYEVAGQTFVTNRILSEVKAYEDLGFRYKVGLKEGLKKLIEWRGK